MIDYDDDPRLASVALQSEDVDTLLLTDGSFLAGSPRRVRHLLSRMRAAFSEHAEQLRSLHRDVDSMREAARVRSSPVANALEALSRLSLAEQEQVYSRRGRVLIDALNEARTQAAAARTAAASETNRARFVLSRLVESQQLPPEARDALLQALADLPARMLGDGPDLVPADTPVPGEFTVAPRSEQAPTG